MTLAEALALLDLLPPYRKNSRAPWYPREGGRYILVNFHRPTRHEDAAVGNRMTTWDAKGNIVDAASWKGTVEPWTIRRLYCLQSRLVKKNLIWVLRNYARASRRRIGPKGKESHAILVIYRGKIFVWNGHHRIMASILLRRPLRCEVVDLSSWGRRWYRRPDGREHGEKRRVSRNRRGRPQGKGGAVR